MKNKPVYYKFWLKSSRGTDELIVRMYNEKQPEETLKSDCEEWASHFGAWVVSENVCSYGWEEVENLPKNREECIKFHKHACEEYFSWRERRELWASLLSHPPFNGKKVE
jgi:hypothetical protein